MAKMIPPMVRQGAPRSERLVFDQLRTGPSAWVVLNSVEIPVRGGDPREIDFLILIPNQAVICLEVKGIPATRSKTEFGVVPVVQLIRPLIKHGTKCTRYGFPKVGISD